MPLGWPRFHFLSTKSSPNEQGWDYNATHGMGLYTGDVRLSMRHGL